MQRIKNSMLTTSCELKQQYHRNYAIQHNIVKI